jgi:hypothetical protein
MAAHRYWALDIGTSGFAGLRRIEMRGSIGGPNLAVGGTAFGKQSTFYAGGPEIVYDADTSNIWGINTSGWCRLGYDFGAPVEIVELSVLTAEYGGVTVIPAATLMYSDDGVRFHAMAPFFSLPGEATYVVNGFTEAASPTSCAPSTRLVSAWPSGPLDGRVDAKAPRWDSVDGGPLRIAGTVKIDDSPDIPVSRRVRMFDLQTAKLIRETWSATDGTYAFEKIRDGKFFLVSHDHTLTENAAIKDQISPEVPT